MQNTYKTFTLTNIIIVLTFLGFTIQYLINNASLIMGLNAYFLVYNFWWQPLSSIFSHGGVLHILMNMAILYAIGNQIEQYRGKIEFIILYFLLGIITSLLSFLYICYFEPQANMVGASGAICVLMGYLTALDSYNRKGLIIWVLLISFAPLLIGLPVAWWAHIIGFILGFIYGVLRK